MKNGRFVAVGTTGDIKALAGKSTQTFDAKQMTIVPGFIDCHNHAGGDDAALRSARRQSVRGRVRHHRAASSTSCAPRRSRRRRAPGSRATSSTTPS